MSRPLWRAVASSSRVLASTWAAPSRPFSLSRAALGHPTRATRYPRWINTKSPPADDDVRLDAPEDEASGSAPPSQSAPPSSIATTAKPAVPPTYTPLLALPIARRPLFPGFYKAVVVRDPAVVAAIKDTLARGQPYLGAFLLKDENNDADVIKGAGEVHDVGVFAQITSVFSSDSAPGEGGAEGTSGGGLTAVLYPHRRIRLTELLSPAASPADPPVVPVTTPAFADAHPAVSIVAVENLDTLPFNPDDQHIRALTSEIIAVFKDIAQLNPLFRDQITNFTMHASAAAPGGAGDKAGGGGSIFDNPASLADFAAAVSTSSSSPSSASPAQDPRRPDAALSPTNDLQDVLQSLDVKERLSKALLVLKKELLNAQLQSKLAREVEGKIARRQREYWLVEQMRGIKRELGLESDGKDKLLDKFRARAAALRMPEGVRKVFDEELSKLAGLEPAASEAGVTRNYLEWLTTIPWGVYSPETFSIPHAQRVLDADHYGLTPLKSRILEFLAVGKLRGSVHGKIILLVGPPGVGKTSIGRSIARALNRQFFRFSVGGLTDVAEIKGHRRTYVVQALKRVGTGNPVVLIDEVDKVGRGVQGDPASALLEMLDPEQNGAFLDHYMDVPIDLSRVLFVCTANTLDTIPAPLLDRMEVLTVSGYVSDEKLEIARRYLVPEAKRDAGLAPPREALPTLAPAPLQDPPEATGDGKTEAGEAGVVVDAGVVKEGEAAVLKGESETAAATIREADVEIEKAALEVLIKWYCRESGVRGLKKIIEKIYRKAALKIVQDLGEDVLPEPTPAVAASTATSAPDTTPTSATSDVSPTSEGAAAGEAATKPVTTAPRAPLQVPASVHVRITPENLKDYVGPPVYQRDRMYGGTYEGGAKGRMPPPGVSTGLGYLGNGSGAVMPVEVVSMPGKGGLKLTGKLGEVIRESAHISLSWVKSHAVELGITPSASSDVNGSSPAALDSRGGTFLDTRDIHEGPSAGTALVSAFVSLFTKTRINPDIAMTGEISLVGQVLPVGGLKEKILAAHRAGITTIVAPAANRADIEENEENVPASVREGIRFVLAEVFRGEKIVERWREQGLVGPEIPILESESLPAKEAVVAEL
ncbi:Lon protease C-terminal proteolytic domain-containing protein [Mycena olivaceomarginata]|nr:Lon protease C-terminal proteolytic domain-containing protein [Mycena olivaceomarginata]